MGRRDDSGASRRPVRKVRRVVRTQVGKGDGGLDQVLVLEVMKKSQIEESFSK